MHIKHGEIYVGFGARHVNELSAIEMADNVPAMSAFTPFSLHRCECLSYQTKIAQLHMSALFHQLEQKLH